MLVKVIFVLSLVAIMLGEYGVLEWYVLNHPYERWIDVISLMLLFLIFMEILVLFFQLYDRFVYKFLD